MRRIYSKHGREEMRGRKSRKWDRLENLSIGGMIILSWWEGLCLAEGMDKWRDLGNTALKFGSHKMHGIS